MGAAWQDSTIDPARQESARIDGERGQLLSTTAETKAKIGEAQLQIVKIDQDFRTEVVKELNESQGKEAELAEHAVAAKDQLDRIELRSPTAGVVNQLNAHTIGGVIKAGSAIFSSVFMLMWWFGKFLTKISMQHQDQY